MIYTIGEQEVKANLKLQMSGHVLGMKRSYLQCTMLVTTKNPHFISVDLTSDRSIRKISKYCYAIACEVTAAISALGQLPIGDDLCQYLPPGTDISHNALWLAARVHPNYHAHNSYCLVFSGLVLGLQPAHERWLYKVLPSLIGWAHT